MRTALGNQKGVVLVFILGGVLTVSLLAGTFVHSTVYEGRYTAQSQAGLQAFALSESGINRGLQWLRTQPSPPSGTQPLVLFGGTQTLGDGAYLVRIVPDPGNGSAQLNRYTIESWGGTGPETSLTALRQTRLVVQQESFSRYAYFTNQERFGPHNVWFVTGDHITGPTHTNGRFRISGQPVFDGDVSSVFDSIQYFNPPPPGGNAPVFNGTVTLGADSISLPPRPPASLTQAAASGGISLRGDTEVTLLPNGRMRVTNSRAGYDDEEIDLPGNGVLHVESGNVTLQGTLSGQLTISSSHDVVIQDSVTYANDPLLNPASQDILGIISGRDVEIDTNAPDNVTVQAAIMALGTSFLVQNWGAGPPKETLTLLGGLIQKNRGPVGTFNSQTGNKTSGYSKDYTYDQRLQGLIPPFFPLTGEYVSLLWKEE